MKREINRWYSWAGYEAYKWKNIDDLKDLLGLTAKCVVNIQTVDQNGVLLEVQNRLVGQHVWIHPCLFQVVSIHKEPRSLWVNEESSPVGAISVYYTREQAIKHGNLQQASRIAIEYVEKRRD